MKRSDYSAKDRLEDQLLLLIQHILEPLSGSYSLKTVLVKLANPAQHLLDLCT